MKLQKMERSLDIFLKTKIRTSPAFDTYWRFAAERQEIFMKRIASEPPPWTRDPILLKNKFTNAYRASDRVSQYLIRKVIYKGSYSLEDTVFRILLFKLFNKIETWQLLENSFGEINYEIFSLKRFSQVLDKAMKSRRTIYSSAYLMPAAPANRRGLRKHVTHLMLLEKMMDDGLPQKIADASSLKQVYELLLGYPSIGPFLGYQYAIDINYCPYVNFSEMEFVVPGPGARDGIRKCFISSGGLSEVEVIKWVAERQHEEFLAREIKFKGLWGRSLQLIDCQNLFCEVDKYSREKHPNIKGLSGRTRIKQRFHANMDPIDPWYPPKWGINDKLKVQRTGSNLALAFGQTVKVTLG